MRIECVGSGSLGLLFAARLSDAGADVVLITSTEEQADRLNAEGVALQDGSGTIYRAVAAECYREAAAGSPDSEERDADWLLLTVKQKHITPELARWLAKRIGLKTRLICFQNGIGHAERLAAEIPPDRIYVAVTTEGARRDGLNHVSHTGRGVTRVGKAFTGSGGNGSKNGTYVPHSEDAQDDAYFDENEKNMRQLFLSAGFETFLSKHMDSFIWQKLLINAVINPLTALLGVTNGKLPELPECRELMDKLVAEVCEVASANGIPLQTGGMISEVLDVCVRTALNHSSMLQDLASGRMTEIEWINGSLLREADEHHIALPVNRTLYALVKAKERTIVKES